MTPQQVRAQIEGAFKREWGSSPPVDYNNDMQSVPPVPFVRLAVRHGGDAIAQAMTGDLIRYERYGIAFVQVFTALGVGGSPADQLARRAVEILEGREFAVPSPDTLSLDAATQTDIGANENGHWQINVSIPFTYTDHRVKRYG